MDPSLAGSVAAKNRLGRLSSVSPTVFEELAESIRGIAGNKNFFPPKDALCTIQILLVFSFF